MPTVSMETRVCKSQRNEIADALEKRYRMLQTQLDATQDDRYYHKMVEVERILAAIKFDCLDKLNHL